jgi:hypothetical protein
VPNVPDSFNIGHKTQIKDKENNPDSFNIGHKTQIKDKENNPDSFNIGHKTQIKDKGQTIQWLKERGKKTKGQTAIYKTLHRKLKIEQHEPH